MVDVRGWDWLTDLGPLIFWLLYVNWGVDQRKPRLVSGHSLVTNPRLGVRNSCDNLLWWNLQLSSSFCFSHTSTPQWETEQYHSPTVPSPTGQLYTSSSVSCGWVRLKITQIWADWNKFSSFSLWDSLPLTSVKVWNGLPFPSPSLLLDLQGNL